MQLNGKCILGLLLTGCMVPSLASASPGQIQIWAHAQSLMPADEARELFNAGQRFFDEYRLRDAENKFREVVRRFPKNAIADRADYYLIRTLAQVGKKDEALGRINGFARQYPKSRWLGEVQELRIQLTNQVPPRGETILLRTSVQTAPAKPAVPVEAVRVSGGVVPAIPPIPPVPRVPVSVISFEFQVADPEISLQQEIMHAMFRNNAQRAIEIASERLKGNPADPVVLSSLNAIASSRSPQAMSMLLGIVRTSTNDKARRDAIFWLGQSRGDDEAIVDTLVGLMPSLSEADSEAVAYTLSRMRSDKSLNALAVIARDKSKSEKARSNAVFWIGQSRASNRVELLDDVYKNSMDNSKVRQQVLFALNQVRAPQTVTIMSGIASTDPDFEVRRQAIFWLGQNKGPEASQALENLLRRK